jgi:phage terminase small subunit
MTQKQQKFCAQYATGMPASHAYQAVYGGKVTTARTNASKLLANPEIEAEVHRLRKLAREAADEGVVLSILEKRKWIAGAVRANVHELTPEDKSKAPYIKKITTRVIGSGEAAAAVTEIEGYDKARLIELDTDLAGDGAEQPGIAALGQFLAQAIDPAGKVIPTDKM